MRLILRRRLAANLLHHTARQGTKQLRTPCCVCIRGTPVGKFIPFAAIACCCVATTSLRALPAPKHHEDLPKHQDDALKQDDAPKPKFTFRDATGTEETAEVVSSYQPDKIVQPFAKIDRKMNPKLMRAATIAQERSHAHSRSRCWHYVKEALLASGVIDSRPKSEFAKEAADDLVKNFGFRKLPMRDPYLAPIGSVLVYGARRAAGHVEFRTREGFVSDFRSKTPSRRPLLGVYTKS